MNVNEAIQQAYFRHHAVNKKSELTLFPPIQNYQKLQYDQELLMIIKEAEILKSNPCDETRKKPASNFGPPPNSNQTFVLYYQQVKSFRFERRLCSIFIFSLILMI